jgi:hypothetical protein
MKERMERFLSGFVCVFDGLIRIITLGFCSSDYELRYWCWVMNKRDEIELDGYVDKDTPVTDTDIDDIRNKLE